MKVLQSMVHLKLHRIGVVEAAGSSELVGIISQGALLRWLAPHIAKLPTAHQPVVEVFASDEAEPVLALPVTATAREALDALVATGFSGAPITDDADTVVADIAVADIRALARAAHHDRAAAETLLDKPLLEFLREMRHKTAELEKSSAPGAPPSAAASTSALVVNGKDTVMTAVECMQAARAHRCFLIDDKRTLVGLLTTSDLLQHVLEELEK